MTENNAGVKVWWADLDEDQEDYDISVGTLLKEHPRQGPLDWQGRLFEVVPKSDFDALQKKYQELQRKVEEQSKEIARLTKFLGKYELLEIIEEWQMIWMNQTQNSEQDRQNYYRRAFGVDANMKHSLARMLWSKALNPSNNSETPNSSGKGDELPDTKLNAKQGDL